MKKMKIDTKKRMAFSRGFSLIELLLVMAILAILSSIVMMNMGSTTEKTKISATKAQLTELRNAISRFQINNDGNPPTSEQGLAALYNRQSDIKDWERTIGKLVENDSWGSPFVYNSPSEDEDSAYDLYSIGPDKQDGTADDIGRDTGAE